MMQRRVVVTGLGTLSALAAQVPQFWHRLVEGKRAIRRISRFYPVGLRNEKAGEVAQWSFQPEYFGLCVAPDEATQFLLLAADEAISDAGLSAAEMTGTGAIVATNFGGAMAWERYVASVLNDELRVGAFDDFRFDSPLDHCVRNWALSGPTSLISSACASGTAAVGYGFDLIRRGCADLMLVGGCDCLAPSHLAGLSVLRTITAEDIRPFARGRSGTIFGEGAAVLVLEERSRAAARGADIYCEVIGSGQDNDAHHLTAPNESGDGIRRVLGRALDDARLAADKVDYINAHGTGTRYHDPAETTAIKAVLGEHAYQIGISSIKAAIGHLMGASGAVEAVATVKAIQEGVAPPTVNYDEPDPECDLDYIPNTARGMEISCAVNLSSGLGGTNAAVVFNAV